MYEGSGALKLTSRLAVQLNLMPVLCGYKMHLHHVLLDRRETSEGAVVIHVARRGDILKEFELSTRDVVRGWRHLRLQPGRYKPANFELTWWRPYCWPEMF